MIYLKLFITFFKIGLFSFGGGYAMLPLIQTEVVDVNSWISISEFTDIVAISQVTPGPIAVNSATYIGYTVTNSVIGSFCYIRSNAAFCNHYAYYLQFFL